MIQGKPYQNQIEAVRNIARCLPVGMKLVTKEHPRSAGYRGYRYYEKLLRIPNVVLVDPNVEAKAVLQHAKIVINIWSFIGFEAAVYRKPVISLGTPIFSIFPRSMVRHVRDFGQLYSEMEDLLKNHRHQERSVVNFVAVALRGGVPVNFFTSHLKKQGRYGKELDLESAKESFSRFTAYTVQHIRRVVGSEESSRGQAAASARV